MAQAILEEPKQAKKTRRMTWEEFLCMDAEGHHHLEWVNGEVIKPMPVQDRHESISGFLHVLLTLHVTKFDLGRVFSEFMMRLASRPAGRVPDVSFLRKENRGRIKNSFVEGPMDLAVEVISPDSEERDRVDKFGEYERDNVREYWLFDHFKREAFFYQLDVQGNYQRVLPDEAGRYDSVVLPGFWLNVNWLWQESKPLMEAMAQLQLP